MTILYNEWLIQNNLQDSEMSRQRWNYEAKQLIYAGGSAFGNWESSPVRYQASTEKVDDFGNEYVVCDVMSIIPDDKGGYTFVERNEYYYASGDVTPESIDEIIAKLQHFKRVVLGVE